MGDPPSIPTDATDLNDDFSSQVFALLAARMISASHVQAFSELEELNSPRVHSKGLAYL